MKNYPTELYCDHCNQILIRIDTLQNIRELKPYVQLTGTLTEIKPRDDDHEYNYQSRILEGTREFCNEACLIASFDKAVLIK